MAATSTPRLTSSSSPSIFAAVSNEQFREFLRDVVEDTAAAPAITAKLLEEIQEAATKVQGIALVGTQLAGSSSKRLKIKGYSDYDVLVVLELPEHSHYQNPSVAGGETKIFAPSQQEVDSTDYSLRASVIVEKALMLLGQREPGIAINLLDTEIPRNITSIEVKHTDGTHTEFDLVPVVKAPGSVDGDYYMPTGGGKSGWSASFTRTQLKAIEELKPHERDVILLLKFLKYRLGWKVPSFTFELLVLTTKDDALDCQRLLLKILMGARSTLGSPTGLAYNDRPGVLKLNDDMAKEICSSMEQAAKKLREKGVDYLKGLLLSSSAGDASDGLHDLPRLASPPAAPSCENCQENPADFGCAECEAKLCSACWPKVHKVGALLRHEKGSLAASLSQCSKHKEKLNYMCVDARCSNKGELMCSLCRDTAPHKGHQTQVLIEVFDDKRRQLQSAIDRVSECVVFAGGVLDQVNTIDHQLRPNNTSTSSSSSSSNNRDKAVKLINAHFDELARQVEARRAVLISEVDGVVGRKAGKLEKQRREVEEYLATSKSAVQAASETLSSSNASEFFSSFSRVHEQLEQVSTRRLKLRGSAVVTSLIEVRLGGGDAVGDAVRGHGAVIDDGDVAQPRQLAPAPRKVKLIRHSLIGGGDGVAGSVPLAVSELHGDAVQLHCVRWNSGRCHRKLGISRGGYGIQCMSKKDGVDWKNCFGVASNASGGFVGGVHFFSIRVSNPGLNGNIMVGFSDGKLSTTENAYPGGGAHNGDLGACLCLYNGEVFFPQTAGKSNAPCATGVKRVCSMGVLLDLEACKVSFFIDGANLHKNGPFPHYPVPARKTWFPFVSLRHLNETITSETFN